MGANLWDDEFSNESAMMRMSNGGMMRVNEFRRVGWKGIAGGVLMRLYNTKGCFEQNAGSCLWSTIDSKDPMDLSELLTCGEVPVNASRADEDRAVLEDFCSGVSKVHPIRRLPKEYIDLLSGHLGSHQFLADDSCEAVVTNTLPPNHVWAATRNCLPGLVAHQSAAREGEMLEIPDWGNRPDHWQMLDPEDAGS